MTAPPRRILVTGARGFLGRTLLGQLRTRFPDAELVAVSRRLAGPDDYLGPELDLEQEQAWESLAGPLPWVFHLAAQIPARGAAPLDPRHFEANTRPCLHLARHCDRLGVERLIYASSISVYPMGAAPLLHEDLLPMPDTLYGAAKLGGERILALAARRGAGVVSLRLSSLYGPGQSQETVLPLFMAKAARGEPLHVMAGGTRTQDFLHVEDAARGMIAAALSPASGVYNLGSGTSTSMRELAVMISALYGERSPVLDQGGVDTSASVAVSTERARREWGFAPAITIANGLKACHEALLEGRS